MARRGANRANNPPKDPPEGDPPVVQATPPREQAESSGSTRGRQAGQDSGPVDRREPGPDPGNPGDPVGPEDAGSPVVQSHHSLQDEVNASVERLLEEKLASLTASFDERVRIAVAAQVPAASSTDEREERLKIQEAQLEVYRSRDNNSDGRSGGKNLTPPTYSPTTYEGPTQWLYDMELYFNYAKVKSKDKVDQALMVLRDGAKAWYQTHCLNTRDGQGRPTAERMTDWDVFSAALMEQFTPDAERKVQRLRLYDLRQTGSVQAFTVAFRELMYKLGDVTETEACTLYERGLKQVVQDNIHNQHPETLKEIISCAEKWDARGVGTIVVSSSSSSSRSSSNTRTGRFIPRRKGARLNATGAETPESSGTAVAAVSKTRPRGKAPGPPDEEKLRLRKEGRCFTCKQTGHLARDCPQGKGNRQ